MKTNEVRERLQNLFGAEMILLYSKFDGPKSFELSLNCLRPKGDEYALSQLFEPSLIQICIERLFDVFC